MTIHYKNGTNEESLNKSLEISSCAYNLLHGLEQFYIDRRILFRIQVNLKTTLNKLFTIDGDSQGIGTSDISKPRT